jgi:hypothetical protein
MEHQSDNVSLSCTTYIYLVKLIVYSIEPGGVRTDWNKGNMISLPSHPAYTGPNTPSSAMRPLIHNEYTGDPVKGEASATALYIAHWVLTKQVPP